MLRRVLFFFCIASFTANAGFAQESSSQPSAPVANVHAVPSAATTPAIALRDVLSAACSQSQTDFARFLTARNKQAFARMTPLARIALMKRFVLLNEPGKPTASTNPAGRPILRCQTPAVTTEMQIGGAELRDNIVFLPMELRDTTDPTAATVRQITMGLVREDAEWKLLSLGLLLLDLPSLEAEWDAAEADATEHGALEALRAIADAVEIYRKKFTRLPESLANLGPPVRGSANADAADLLDSAFATGMKNGYAFRYVIAGASNLGAPAKFELAATPLRYGRTGKLSFFRDSNGGFHAADRNGTIGSASDPKVE
ncbi:MAG: hypothetical protein DMG44_00595 [Acidobacteria bacterium]|nr:MAG: hypothetical protein DMG44_00595 [Acidobacteriota bacterium]